ncbi:MAG: hypothetical protein KDK70_36640, partial [Myxococcales bacterium]|nr:hypothetical protein [Myxococcales bacterium]
MSVEPTEFRPRPDEEAVHHPQLRRLVEAARAQPMPRVRVDEEAVLAGWQEHRARRRRAVGMGLAAAAVVVLALTVVLP